MQREDRIRVLHMVPWRAITLMRNRLIHGYADIDPGVVWVTATEEVPAVLPLLQALVDASA
ncbi:MAG TPA: HepT-like ribonuclease domain-containing protein [Desulfobacterales bacterium]|nr:HepT-like ribonuclease domain-containing protein [Desulfobacterales bacterium]